MNFWESLDGDPFVELMDIESIQKSVLLLYFYFFFMGIFFSYNENINFCLNLYDKV